MTYPLRLVGGPKGGRTITAKTFWGHRVPLRRGTYVLVTPPPTVPPDGCECVYRWEPKKETPR